MKLLNFFSALLLAALLAGCAPVDSLNPLYTDKNVVFDEALLGQWGTAEEGLNFAKIGDNGYRLVLTGKDDDTGQIMTMVFDAHLVDLDGHRFLDLVCKKCEALDDSKSLPEVHVIRTPDGLKIKPRLISAGGSAYFELLPGESDGDDDRLSMRRRQAHWFFKVLMEDEGQTLKMVQLDDSWIDHQIQEGNLLIDHEIMEGKSAVLTASTPDLQKLVLDHVDDEEAFRGETMVKRAGAELAQ